MRDFDNNREVKRRILDWEDIIRAIVMVAIVSSLFLFMWLT